MHGIETIKVGSRKKFRCGVDGCEWNGASRQGLLSHKVKYHSVQPRQKPVKCPECCERFHTVKNLARHALDKHKIEGQNFELQSRSFRSRAEFDDFMQYIRMETSGSMTTISVKDKCTYMRCEMAGKARHLADSLSGRISHGTKKVISHCTCFMNVRTEGNGSINVEYVLGHLGHEKTPVKIRYTALEIEAILLLLKEKRSPHWIIHYFKENTLENDKLHALSRSDIRSIMYSYLNSEEQEEIIGLEREEANSNFNWASTPICNSALLLETMSRIEPLSVEEYASENENEAVEITISTNMSGQITPGAHLQSGKRFDALVEDTRLKLMELFDLVFQVNENRIEELNSKVIDALNFAKQNMIYRTDSELLARNPDAESLRMDAIPPCANPEEMNHKQNMISGHDFAAISGTLTYFA
uniref:C2H2-type domain-containing protein n=1 Tax=Setaria digitata TaxID=48799 RepID=A0A915PQZ5_9BILA